MPAVLSHVATSHMRLLIEMCYKQNTQQLLKMIQRNKKGR